MEEFMRKNKMLVVADESGNILAALWPGMQTEGAPSYTGFNLSADQVAYEVEIPGEFYEPAPPDLTHYYLQMMGGPTLRRKPAG
jgi:hypothetical protein